MQAGGADDLRYDAGKAPEGNVTRCHRASGIIAGCSYTRHRCPAERVVGHDINEHEKARAGEAAHYGFGLPYGGAVAVIADEVLVPATGLSGPPWRSSPKCTPTPSSRISSLVRPWRRPGASCSAVSEACRPRDIQELTGLVQRRRDALEAVFLRLQQRQDHREALTAKRTAPFITCPSLPKARHSSR
jgi:hypothetical protein